MHHADGLVEVQAVQHYVDVDVVFRRQCNLLILDRIFCQAADRVFVIQPKGADERIVRPPRHAQERVQRAQQAIERHADGMCPRCQEWTDDRRFRTKDLCKQLAELFPANVCQAIAGGRREVPLLDADLLEGVQYLERIIFLDLLHRSDLVGAAPLDFEHIVDDAVINPVYFA